MPRPLLVLCALLSAAPAVAEEAKGPVLAGKNTPLKPLVRGLKNPESVCLGPDGRVYVTTIGDFDKNGDGAVMVVHDGKAEVFAKNLDDPKGILSFAGSLFVTDKTKVLRIDMKGNVTTFADAKIFPRPPQFLNDIEVDSSFQFGKPPALYVSDSGDLKGGGGVVFRIALTLDRSGAKAGKITVLTDGEKDKGLKTPNGLKMASEYHLFLLDFGSGDLSRINLHDGKRTKLADGFGGGDGIARDMVGRLYLSSWTSGKVWVIPRAGDKPVLLASGFAQAADCCLAADQRSILVPDMKAGTLTAVPCTVPGAEVDESELNVGIVQAFPDLKWEEWNDTDDRGKTMLQRPMLLTHAGDGSDRVFVAEQRGQVHVFANDQKATQAKLFLDIRKQVRYVDTENEEGLLGLAFAPDHKASGVFYVYYTPRRKQGERPYNVLSRFRVSKQDAGRADAASEEIVLRLPPKPLWNHDGGTLVFGPDGMLYVAVGDGGGANDPLDAGQDMNSLLGKILRIDVSKKDDGLGYAVPKDNPFVGTKGVRGEIWSSGWRNPWRMSFDRKTNRLWAADVGQNLWEEINLVTKGGNYGWNRRESLHPFGVKGVGPNKDMIDPIWEYHHDVGKSITGGHVYRGDRVKKLEGLYLYADYVSGHVWGLRYDEKLKRVTENRLLRRGGFAVYSFGEDEKGDVYLLTSQSGGKVLYRFADK